MPKATYEASAFSFLKGWQQETDLAEALAAFADCWPAFRRLGAQQRSDPIVCSLAVLSVRAAELNEAEVTSEAARAFFEEHFLPHRVVDSAPQGLLTGYYEPILRASRSKSDEFGIPLYARPDDLVDLDEHRSLRTDGQVLTHARSTDEGLLPYATRAEIENGYLEGRGLEIAYLSDPVDAFFMQVQGSGLLEFSANERVRFGFDGKNGRPYTSIGRKIIENGLMSREDMSLQALGDWLRVDPERGRDMMRANESFVFFKETGAAATFRPTGVHDIPLTPGRSLAVDASCHPIGVPIFVASDDLKHAPWSDSGFRRLMVAQDIGSAIVGPERGDIYFGSGVAAGLAAGKTQHSGNFFVLLPKQLGIQ